MAFLRGFREKIGQMNPKNYVLMKNDSFDYKYMQKEAQLRAAFSSNFASNGRPYNATLYLDGPNGARVPIYTINPNIAYQLAETVGDWRSVLQDIQREIFRNGIKIKPNYKYKCMKCLKEYKEKPLAKYIPMDQAGTKQKKDKLYCDDCGNTEKWKEPKSRNRVVLQTIHDEPVNNNGQRLLDILKESLRDINIIDDCYTLVSRDYAIETLKEPDPETGATKRAFLSVKKSKVAEILRIDPRTVGLIHNNANVFGYNRDNVPQYICPDMNHRDTTTTATACPQCGLETFSAFLTTNALPNGLPNNAGSNQIMTYARHEVIYVPGMYSPGPVHGVPPIASIWKKVFSLMYQDEYMWKYFDKDRPAKGLLIIGSRNAESIQAFNERQKQGADVEPYTPRPVMLKTDDVRKSIQYIDLTPNLKELELGELRKEQRQIILAMYGLQPLYVGEQQKGGMGNESLQVTLSNRAMKDIQVFLNERYLTQINDIFGIKDWSIKIEDVEEVDKLRELQIKGEEYKNATTLFAMGYDNEFDGDGELVISQKPNPERLKMMIEGPPGQNVTNGQTSKVKDSGAANKKQVKFDGEHKKTKASDIGGTNGGAPESGPGTTLSNKSSKKKYIIKSNKDGSKEVEEQ